MPRLERSTRPKWRTREWMESVSTLALFVITKRYIGAALLPRRKILAEGTHETSRISQSRRADRRCHRGHRCGHARHCAVDVQRHLSSGVDCAMAGTSSFPKSL